MTENLKNLADHVKARRDEKDWTQIDVYRRGGPSNSKLTEIEDARPPAPSRSTLKKLDVGLEWEAGSAKTALAGGTPTPITVLTRTGTADVSVSARDETDNVPAWNARRPEGMTDERYAQIMRETEEYHRFLLDKASKER